MSSTPPATPARPQPLDPVDRMLADLHARISGHPLRGRVADYIPELGTADPAHFGIAVATTGGDVHEAGDSGVAFTIQSISKALIYGMALEDRGPEAVEAVVGVEPSGEAFNSIRLNPERGTPLNPMVNAGAIAVTGLIRGDGASGRLDRILETVARYTGRPAAVDERVARSESETGHRNRAIAHLLRGSGVFSGDPDEVLETYFRQCAILVTCRDLAVVGATLANRGVNPLTGERALQEAHVTSVLTIMATCGMYDSAGRWLHDVGLPAKSGVAGGILAVLPGQLGIGTFSPPLDTYGNSVRGIEVCRALSSELDLHLFDPPRPAEAHRGMPVGRAQSRRRRAPREGEVLERAADRIILHRPRGDLTFTAAVAMGRSLAAACADDGFVVLDVSEVSRLDRADAAILIGLGAALAERRARLLLCGANGRPVLEREFARRGGAGVLPLELWDDAEGALEWCEERILAEAGVLDGDGTVPLERSELCRRLSAEDCAALAARMAPVSFAAGEVILRVGAPSDHLMVLGSGRASAVTDRADGSRIRVTTIGPGMFIGEMGLIDGDPRSATVVADTAVTGWRLDREAFDALAAGPGAAIHTALLLTIAEGLSAHLRRATALLAAIG